MMWILSMENLFFDLVRQHAAILIKLLALLLDLGMIGLKVIDQ